MKRQKNEEYKNNQIIIMNIFNFTFYIKNDTMKFYFQF